MKGLLILRKGESKMQPHKVTDEDNKTKLRQIYEKYKNRAPYIHFKTTIDGIMQPKMVMDADVNFKKYFSLIPCDAWLCVEIPASETVAQTKENIIDALVSMKSFAM